MMKFLLAFCVAVLGFEGLSNPVYAGITGVAGIYKGTYTSYAAGGDYGTVTIVINEQGGTACNFRTTIGNYDNITTGGSVVETSPYLNLICGSVGISNGGYWTAQTTAPSTVDGALSGTWTFAGGVQAGNSVPPTGSFEANYVAAYAPIDPAAMAGMWNGPAFWGGFNIFPAANAGLVVSFIGVTDTYETSNGQLIGPPPGSPIWLLSSVGPKTILPGIAITLTMYAPSTPPDKVTIPWPPTTMTTSGTLVLTFIDCHTAAISMSGPNPLWGSIDMIDGVAGAPGC